MAYCPQCRGEMGERDAACPHCGYDFPLRPDRAAIRHGIEYSIWADIALMIGAVVAGLGCLCSVIGSVVAIFQNQLMQGLVFGPIAAFLFLAMLVVFLRIQKL
jgi:hypothetical protein